MVITILVSQLENFLINIYREQSSLRICKCIKKCIWGGKITKFMFYGGTLLVLQLEKYLIKIK